MTLNQPFRNAGKSTSRSASARGGGPENRFHGLIDDVRVYDACSDADEIAALALGEPIAEIAAIAGRERTERRRDKLRWYFLEQCGAARDPRGLEATCRRCARARAAGADASPR